ncbi:MAG: DegT/DnrJ/EryC1/StrS family aminotransferase [Kiritimatiellia bacterium]
MRVFLSPPWMNGTAEREAVAAAFDSNYIAPCGPMVDALEQEAARRFGFTDVLATVSGTMALELIARAMEIRSGDEVIASNLTFIASVAPFVTLGATPIFVGSEPSTWTMSPTLLECALKAHPRARAVIATDLYGQSCDLDALISLCEAYGVKLISDAAESVGATYRGRASGVGAWATVYSLNGNKIITSGGGGLLLSSDRALMVKCRSLACQAREPVAWYEHRCVGTHGRMGNIPAAVGWAQLRHLDEALHDKAQVWEAWNERFVSHSWISPMPTAAYGTPNRWLTVALLDGCDPLVATEVLAKRGIEARPLWKPMVLQPVFEKMEAFGTEIDAMLFKRGICLPSGRGIKVEIMDEILELLEEAR